MKKSELFFTLFLLPFDAFIIFIGFIIAYWLRVEQEVVYIIPQNEFYVFILRQIPIWLLIFAMAGLYKINRPKNLFDQMSSIVLGVSSGIMLTIIWSFFSNTDLFSRLIVLYSWVLVAVLMILGRWLINSLQAFLHKFGIGTHNLIIIGNNTNAYNILKNINANNGYKFLGIVESSNEKNKEKQNLRILGNLDNFENILNKNLVDDVILTDLALGEEKISKLIDLCHDKNMIFKHLPNSYGITTKNIEISTIAGMPIIYLRHTPLDGWGRILKRITDIVLGLIGIIIFSPIMLIVAIMIKLDSKGPIIYKNERVRENNKLFNTYKFRTMKIEFCTGSQYGGSEAENIEKKLINEKNERSGPVYKVLNDPRRTRLGKFLEKTSLDELPQFFNVLIGNMSMVGPRPHQPREVEKYEAWQRKVLRIKPGVTGLAQISGRSDLNFSEEAKLDIFYIENWSFLGDIKIVFKTPFSLIKPRKAV